MGNELENSYRFLLKNKYIHRDYLKSGKNINLNTGQLHRDGAFVYDRMIGALTGGAVGDSIGKSYEGRMPGTYDVSQLLNKIRSGGRIIQNITDDTQLTLRLAKTLISDKGIDPDNLCYNMFNEKIVGIGSATLEALTNYKTKHKKWYECGTHSAGTGAAMRSVPIGLYYKNSYKELKLASIINTVVTHNDSMAIASSIVMSLAAAWLLREYGLDDIGRKVWFSKFLASAIEGMEDNKYRSRNSRVSSTIESRLSKDIPYFLERNFHPMEVNKKLYSGAYVLESLPVAIYCFLYSPDDFETTLINAVNCSKDSDTVASMACSLSGAYLGKKMIPEYLYSGIRVYKMINESSKKIFHSDKNYRNIRVN